MSQIPTGGTPPENTPGPRPAPQANTTPLPTQIVERALTLFATVNPHSDAIVNRLRPILLREGGPSADAILVALRPDEAANETT